MVSSEPVRVIEATNVVRHYPITQGILFKKQIGSVQAVDDVTLYLNAGETLAIVGESGCGKSTTGRLLMGLEAPDSGSIKINGQEITGLSGRAMRAKRRDIQIILQDPYTSLEPTHDGWLHHRRALRHPPRRAARGHVEEGCRGVR